MSFARRARRHRSGLSRSGSGTPTRLAAPLLCTRVGSQSHTGHQVITAAAAAVAVAVAGPVSSSEQPSLLALWRTTLLSSLSKSAPWSPSNQKPQSGDAVHKLSPSPSQGCTYWKKIRQDDHQDFDYLHKC
ncbi:hypothetical protein CAOG_005732 [Capsaspora owczarzaki ATCC 30864]|uniref:Uncharacterized protein n=1 Tax=Capsaspora owczarzaki (strain ATCC 30864) TaxID=595528 RepID=A0A0D2X413_CAPO3|nr:hypothetical protein CAOG_005732 [Capsaspora owczarzaki ATCC 30864]